MIRSPFAVIAKSILVLVAVVLGLPTFAQSDGTESPTYKSLSATQAMTNLLAKHRKRSGVRASALYQFGLDPEDEDDDDEDKDNKFATRAPFLNPFNRFTSYGVNGFPGYGYGRYGGYGGYGSFGGGRCGSGGFGNTTLFYPAITNVTIFGGGGRQAQFFTPRAPQTIWRTNVANPRSPFSMGAMVRESARQQIRNASP